MVLKPIANEFFAFAIGRSQMAWYAFNRTLLVGCGELVGGLEIASETHG